MKITGKGLWSIISQIVLILAAIASLLGLVVLLFSDPMKANIALGFFCVAVLILFYKLLSTLNDYLKSGSPNGYSNDSSYVRYSTRDGVNIEYEIYKFIQCKKLIMTEHEYGYKWSGSQEPEVFSDIQEVSKLIKASNGTYDKCF